MASKYFLVLQPLDPSHYVLSSQQRNEGDDFHKYTKETDTFRHFTIFNSFFLLRLKHLASKETYFSHFVLVLGPG